MTPSVSARARGRGVDAGVGCDGAAGHATGEHTGQRAQAEERHGTAAGEAAHLLEDVGRFSILQPRAISEPLSAA